jgi:diguanylate cyclase (GGDEF)-like protein/PAS domain S-box-containing protein
VAIPDRTSTEGLHSHTGAIERLFDVADDLLATLDRDGRFTAVNPAWERTLGWPEEELLGARAVDLVHPLDLESMRGLAGGHRDAVEFENRCRCKDGSYRRLEWRARLVEGTWYGVARDITRSRSDRLQTARDPLTGLANRTAAIERLELAIARLGRQPGLVGVLFVDLDHFKMINDTRGHDIGDRFLCAAATRMLDSVRAVDLVARFGGDEFLILLEDAATIPDVTEVAGRVVRALERPVSIGGLQLRIGASVGVATAARHGTRPQSLLREADLAMYQAKARGGGRYAMFEAAPRRSAIN